MKNEEIHMQFMAAVAPAIAQITWDIANVRHDVRHFPRSTFDGIDERIAKNCVEAADAMLLAYLRRWPKLTEPTKAPLPIAPPPPIKKGI